VTARQKNVGANTVREGGGCVKRFGDSDTLVSRGSLPCLTLLSFEVYEVWEDSRERDQRMPTISIFYGVVIQMFAGDHPPPHFSRDVCGT
jgi:hypothetical protein